MTYRRLPTGNYIAYSGPYYVFLRRRKHYKREGFLVFGSWWTAYIGKGGEWLESEGVFGSSLNTLVKAKKWVKHKLKTLTNEQQT